jgi:sugar-specific transcriptional regulator TrmB/DNA-binding CsgD family transcriptional regulator
MLEVIGLDRTAEQIYDLLVDGRSVTADELGALSELAGVAVHAALRRLERLGLVSRSTGTPARYAAVDPGIALDVLLLDHEDQLKRARVRAHELNERFRLAVAGRDPAELVEVVSGPATIRQRMEQIQRGARRRIRCLDRPPYASDPTAANEIEREFLARGGIAQAIYERSSLAVPGCIAQLEEMALHGEQARLLPAIPTKLILIDERIGAIPLRAAPEQIDSMVIVQSSGLLEALSALFDALWRVALPLQLFDLPDGRPPAPRAGADEDRPTAQEQRLLALLTSGLPDEGISRQLGLSHRTLQRRVHDLMARLHAQTRFQLALQAARRGWLDLDATAPHQRL